MMNKELKLIKKLTCITLSIGLALSAAACGKGQSPKTEAKAGSEADTSMADGSLQDSVTASIPSSANGAENPDTPALLGSAVRHELEFGGAYTDKTIEDFNALGFEYGDSLRVEFSNGYLMNDIPYYSGYYTETNKPLLVAYPGYEAVKLCINNGDDLWNLAALEDGDTVNITLLERGKYRDIQEARDIHYEDDREKYESDEVFANFRSVSAGKIGENVLYRSASPCDNQHKRAPYVDGLMKDAGVNFILDLADNDEKIHGYMNEPAFNSSYFRSLFERGAVLPLSMNANYGSDESRGKIVSGLTFLAQNEGPYLIHCTEGKDRTGYVCMLLEALCGATYEEIRDDYMLTYSNYYGVSKESDPHKYDLIVDLVLNPMIRIVIGDESADVTTANLAECAEKYLMDSGMSKEQIEEVRKALS